MSSPSCSPHLYAASFRITITQIYQLLLLTRPKRPHTFGIQLDYAEVEEPSCQHDDLCKTRVMMYSVLAHFEIICAIVDDVSECQQCRRVCQHGCAPGGIVFVRDEQV